MIICSVQKLSKSFGGHKLFDNLSFEIHENDRIGFVGRNGTGKTSLFRLIAGLEAPDEGVISIQKGASLGFLHQIPDAAASETAEDVLKRAQQELLAIQKAMTSLEKEMAEAKEHELHKLLQKYGALQEQFERLGGYEMETKRKKVASGLNITPLLSQPFSTLSGGEKTKVGLGVILLQSPDLLLLDEPTNHLDIHAVEWLEQFIKEYKGTVISISHDRHFLDETASKILDLEDGEVTVYHHNYSGFTAEKQNRLLHEFQAYQEQQKKIKKMKEAIKRLREWANQANPPSEGLHKRARNMERALERMEKLKRPVLEHKKMALQFEGTDRSGKRAVTVEKASKAFGGKQLFTEADLELLYKDRLAIVGENGSGKSTLIKMMLGEIQPDEGSVKLGSSVKVGYLAQQALSKKEESMTIIDFFRENISMTEEAARHILAKFMFYGPAVFKKMAGTSGGERMRVQLARLMQQDINLLILDEPTNHLDIDSREVLEDAIEQFSGTVLAVSHDRYFLEKLFSKTVWIYNGSVFQLPGSYLYARGKMEPLFQKPAVEKKVLERKKTASELENELAQLEQKLFDLEQQAADQLEIERLEKQREELYNSLLGSM
ncbi:ATP-binding cassette domain-containing protein [Metabacillus sp. GX 13764]|uniref:ribosomal protection-like ABC-F family protein n=1 Tax=Metabacillus kandeliae TaxID=2900151 RepID=UPI001E2EAA75|nr:ABC-F family ATP-binding cassette domain-containing protein [Metabacillus kandeliae]MCD7035237.1 ATP-binding cassette domain-containing protein [Metabacillus kandeliae]